MKSNKFIIILSVLFSFFLIGCNEELNIQNNEQGMPVLLSFAPQTGKAGTEVTLQGEQLRDVLTAQIGGTEATVKYKISQSELVITIPAGAKSGPISLSSPAGTTISEGLFTMMYPVPAVSFIPDNGKVGSDIEIIGVDLDVVSTVYFDDVQANVVYQKGRELVVTVPFVLEDNVTVSFAYFNADGEQRAEVASSFEIIKPQPSLTGMLSSRVKEGEVIVLEGENLHLIEKVLFGEVEANGIQKENGYLSFRVPTLPATATVAVTATYYEGSKILSLNDACEVFIPQVYHYQGIEIGSHRNEIGNLLNATTGDISSPCYLKSAAESKNDEAMQLLDFSGYVNSSCSFIFYGPQSTAGTLKNYWCGGKTFAKGTTVETLTQEGYGAFLGVKTTFMVLDETDVVQNEIIGKVKAGSIEVISPESLPALFNGQIVPTLGTVRSRTKTEAEDLQTAAIFREGSIVLFKNEFKGKIGLVWIKKVSVPYSSASAEVNSSSATTFDIYYER